MSGLIKFEDQDKFFIKFFLLDATLNLNKWGVTEKSLRDGLDSFIGKPFVLTADFDHPTARDGDDLMIQQEKYRVGNIIMVGIEERSGKAYGVAEITNREAIDILKNGDVNFVSPSIVFNSSSEIDINGNAVIDSWEGAHVAAVAEPAYTIEKAQIKGKCAGDKETCLSTLNKVQASRSPCGKYTIVETANKRIIGNASKCVESCIEKKGESGKEIDDQALAICYSECGEAKGNIDQESLKNITKVDLLKKKKNAQDDSDVTSQNKKKITMPKKAKKTKEQLTKELEDYELQMQSFSKEKTNNTSIKSKKSKTDNNMKTDYAEIETKKEDTFEEDEDKKQAQDLTNDEEKRHDEEMKKSKKRGGNDDDKEEINIDTGDEDEKEDADDTDKLDLTDKQKEFLRDSKLDKQVAILKAEVKSLKAHIRKAKLEPIINSILEAKAKLGKVNAEVEYAKLSKLDSATLYDLKANYDQVVDSQNQPRYQVKYASVENSTGDGLFTTMRGKF